MSKLSVREAALLTGKSRETINAATNEGVLSVSLNGRGHKRIEVSELERVFPLVRSVDQVEDRLAGTSLLGSGKASKDNPSDHSIVSTQLQAARSQFSMLQEERRREREQLEAQIENLRQTLSSIQEQHSRTLLLIGDRSERLGPSELAYKKRILGLSKSVRRLSEENQVIADELERVGSRSIWSLFFRGMKRNGPRAS